ncbi:hypothetical protein HK405_011649, partial [Cladochytrium tenue]
SAKTRPWHGSWPRRTRGCSGFARMTTTTAASGECSRRRARRSATSSTSRTPSAPCCAAASCSSASPRMRRSTPRRSHTPSLPPSSGGAPRTRAARCRDRSHTLCLLLLSFVRFSSAPQLVFHGRFWA